MEKNDLLSRLRRTRLALDSTPPPVSTTDEHLFFAHAFNESSLFPMPEAMRLHGPAEHAALRDALTSAIERLEVATKPEAVAAELSRYHSPLPAALGLPW